MNKFVFFGRSNFQYNGFDSMRILLNDVLEDERFFYVEPADSAAFKWLNYFYMDRIGTAIKKRMSVPLRTIAFQKYLQYSKEISKDDQVYFVFVRFEPWFFGEDGFLSYLKQQYPQCKLIYLLINVNRYLGINFEEFCPYFDRVITIDEGDAEKYGLELHSFFYSTIEKEDSSLVESDCFYIGNAKGRLNEIIEAYELLSSIGLKCDFHVIGVPDEQQKHKESIVYNKPMNYDDVVCHVKKSKLLLEIMQEGQTSGTLREHEAVVYGKKLITNNKHIIGRGFYTPENISVFDDIKDIDPAFVRSLEAAAEYPNRDAVSPRAFIQFLEGYE